MSVAVHFDIRTNAAHLQQLFTGLTSLARQRRIKLSYSITAEALATRAPPFAQSIIASLNVNGKPVAFDMSDGAGLSSDALDAHDFYFKRSLPIAWAPASPSRASVRPFGLTYMVMPDGPSAFVLARTLAFPRAGDWPRQILRSLDSGNRLHFSPRQSMLEHPPPETPLDEPSVLFLARAWDAEGDQHFALSDELKEDRHRINETRAQCIRKLRAEYGERALVGMIDDSYARKHYPDCLIDPQVTEKRRYLDVVRKYPICITTTGLHKSIGWKFAEYVAMSRAIVSEPLNYQVPGNFAAGQNYDTFVSADECIERVNSLMVDRDRRLEMMKSNWRYYQESLRPDQAVWHCLSQVV